MKNNLHFEGAEEIYIFPYGNQWMVEVKKDRWNSPPAKDVYADNVFPLPYLVDSMPVGFVYGNIKRANPGTIVEYCRIFSYFIKRKEQMEYL